MRPDGCSPHLGSTRSSGARSSKGHHRRWKLYWTSGLEAWDRSTDSFSADPGPDTPAALPDGAARCRKPRGHDISGSGRGRRQRSLRCGPGRTARSTNEGDFFRHRRRARTSEATAELTMVFADALATLGDQSGRNDYLLDAIEGYRRALAETHARGARAAGLGPDPKTTSATPSRSSATARPVRRALKRPSPRTAMRLPNATRAKARAAGLGPRPKTTSATPLNVLGRPRGRYGAPRRGHHRVPRCAYRMHARACCR